MNLTRRQFMQLSSGLWATLPFASTPWNHIWNLAQAQEPLNLSPTNGTDRFFVMIRIFGGMDVTLGLDPWLLPQRPDAKDMFIEYRDDEVWRNGTLALGPAAHPLIPHAADILTLNGVLVSESDNGHTAAESYMSTGNGQGSAPDVPVELAIAMPHGPYGVLASSRLYRANRLMPMAFQYDLASARQNADPSEMLEKIIPAKPRTPLERAQDELVQSRDITLRLNKYLNDMYATHGDLKNHHVAAAAFLAGASQHALLDVRESGNLDTHANHERNHLTAQKAFWTEVSEIFSFFKSTPYGQDGSSLFDRTTFMIFSDFARTPALNGALGKDHNPMTNSVLLAGRGVQTGKTAGGSRLITAARSHTGSSYHMASPIDFQTGVIPPTRNGAEFIFPENVVLSVAEIMGADRNLFRSVPSTTRVIPGVVKV